MNKLIFMSTTYNTNNNNFQHKLIILLFSLCLMLVLFFYSNLSVYSSSFNKYNFIINENSDSLFNSNYYHNTNFLYLENNKLKQSFLLSNLKDTSFNNEIPKNSIYAEFLGHGFFGSLNYERILYQKNRFSVNGRVGFVPIWMYLALHVFTFPVLINVQIQMTNGISFETGLGTRYIYTRNFVMDKLDGTNSFDIIGNTGFRFLIKNRVLLKIDFTPIFKREHYIEYPTHKDAYKLRVIPWFGLSIGYSFGK